MSRKYRAPGSFTRSGRRICRSANQPLFSLALRRAPLLLLLIASSASVAADARSGADFSGVWQDASLSAAQSRAEDERIGEMFAPLVFPGGKPELKEPYAGRYRAYLAEKRKAEASGKQLADPHTQCVPEGMPHMMLPSMLIEIVQTETKIVLLFEYLGQTRRIYLQEKMPPADEIAPTFTGYSVGHWEGETLVVETRGIREDAMFFHIPHSEQMRVVERLRRVGDLLENHIVVEDPEALAKSYEFSLQYRLAPAHYKPSEYLCENNRYIVEDGADSLDTTIE